MFHISWKFHWKILIGSKVRSFLWKKKKRINTTQQTILLQKRNYFHRMYRLFCTKSESPKLFYHHANQMTQDCYDLMLNRSFIIRMACKLFQHDLPTWATCHSSQCRKNSSVQKKWSRLAQKLIVDTSNISVCSILHKKFHHKWNGPFQSHQIWKKWFAVSC